MAASAATISGATAKNYHYEKNDPITNTEGTENLVWGGKLAEELGYTGSVNQEDFENVIDQKDKDGNPLRTHVKNDDTKVDVLDIVFSAPKSFSIMALTEAQGIQGVDKEKIEELQNNLIELHKEASQKAMDHIEDTMSNYAKSNVDSDGVRSRSIETSGNLLYASALHSGTRAEEMTDMSLHTHKIVINATKTEDGTLKALDMSQMIQTYKNGANDIYMTELAKGAVELGLQIEQKGNGVNFDIVMDQQAIDTFSSRQLEIAEVSMNIILKKDDTNTEADLRNAIETTYTEMTGKIPNEDTTNTDMIKASISGGKYKEFATGVAEEMGVKFDFRDKVHAQHSFKADKKDVTKETVQNHWNEKMQNDTRYSSVDQLIHEAQGETHFSYDSAREVLEKAVELGVKNEYVITEKELLKLATSNSLGQFSYGELKAELDSVSKIGQKEDLDLKLMGVNQKGEKVFSNKGSHEEEKELKELIKDLVESGDKSEFSGVMTKDQAIAGVEAFEAKYFKLTGGQKDAAMSILSGNAQLNVVEGFAGSGKTTMFKAVTFALEHNNNDINALISSFTNKAVQGAINETRLDSGKALEGKTLASMTNEMSKSLGEDSKEIIKDLNDYKKELEAQGDTKSLAIVEQQIETVKDKGIESKAKSKVDQVSKAVSTKLSEIKSKAVAIAKNQEKASEIKDPRSTRQIAEDSALLANTLKSNNAKFESKNDTTKAKFQAIRKEAKIADLERTIALGKSGTNMSNLRNYKTRDTASLIGNSIAAVGDKVIMEGLAAKAKFELEQIKNGKVNFKLNKESEKKISKAEKAELTQNKIDKQRSNQNAIKTLNPNSSLNYGLKRSDLNLVKKFKDNQAKLKRGTEAQLYIQNGAKAFETSAVKVSESKKFDTKTGKGLHGKNLGIQHSTANRNGRTTTVTSGEFKGAVKKEAWGDGIYKNEITFRDGSNFKTEIRNRGVEIDRSNIQSHIATSALNFIYNGQTVETVNSKGEHSITHSNSIVGLRFDQTSQVDQKGNIAEMKGISVLGLSTQKAEVDIKLKGGNTLNIQKSRLAVFGFGKVRRIDTVKDKSGNITNIKVIDTKEVFGIKFGQETVMDLNNSQLKQLNTGGNIKDIIKQASAQIKPISQDRLVKETEVIKYKNGSVTNVRVTDKNGQKTTKDVAIKVTATKEVIETGKKTEKVLAQGLITEKTAEQLLKDIEKGDKSFNGIIIIDEASMISSKQLLTVLKYAKENNLKISLVGDIQQLNSINAGRAFESVLKYVQEYSKLNEVQRQKTDTELTNALNVREKGSNLKTIDSMIKSGNAHEIKNEKDRINKAAELATTKMAVAGKDFKGDHIKDISYKNSVVLAATNRSVGKLNTAIRTKLNESGQINLKEAQIAKTLISVNISDNKQLKASSYKIGQTVQTFEKNVGKMAVGDPYTIIKTDKVNNNLTLKNDKTDHIITMKLKNAAGKINVSEKGTLDFTKGDLAVITVTDKERDLMNSDRGIVTDIDKENKKMTVDFGERGVKEIDMNQPTGIMHAYAMSTTKSQGISIENVIAYVDTAKEKLMTTMNSMHVMLSRQTHISHMVTDGIEKVKSYIQKEQTKTSTLDYENGKQVHNLTKEDIKEVSADMKDKISEAQDKVGDREGRNVSFKEINEKISEGKVERDLGKLEKNDEKYREGQAKFQDAQIVSRDGFDLAKVQAYADKNMDSQNGEQFVSNAAMGAKELENAGILKSEGNGNYSFVDDKAKEILLDNAGKGIEAIAEANLNAYREVASDKGIELKGSAEAKALDNGLVKIDIKDVKEDSVVIAKAEDLKSDTKVEVKAEDLKENNRIKVDVKDVKEGAPVDTKASTVKEDSSVITKADNVKAGTVVEVKASDLKKTERPTEAKDNDVLKVKVESVKPEVKVEAKIEAVDKRSSVTTKSENVKEGTKVEAHGFNIKENATVKTEAKNVKAEIKIETKTENVKSGKEVEVKVDSVKAEAKAEVKEQVKTKTEIESAKEIIGKREGKKLDFKEVKENAAKATTERNEAKSGNSDKLKDAQEKFMNTQAVSRNGVSEKAVQSFADKSVETGRMEKNDADKFVKNTMENADKLKDAGILKTENGKDFKFVDDKAKEVLHDNAGKGIEKIAEANLNAYKEAAQEKGIDLNAKEQVVAKTEDIKGDTKVEVSGSDIKQNSEVKVDIKDVKEDSAVVAKAEDIKSDTKVEVQVSDLKASERTRDMKDTDKIEVNANAVKPEVEITVKSENVKEGSEVKAYGDSIENNATVKTEAKNVEQDTKVEVKTEDIKETVKEEVIKQEPSEKSEKIEVKSENGEVKEFDRNEVKEASEKLDQLKEVEGNLPEGSKVQEAVSSEIKETEREFGDAIKVEKELTQAELKEEKSQGIDTSESKIENEGEKVR